MGGVLSTSLWQKTRRRMLNENPVCERCNRAKATCVHHIRPLRAGGHPFVQANLQALCNPCHKEITAEQRWQY